MDPNAALNRQRELVGELMDQFDKEGETFTPSGATVYELLTVIQALDNWATHSGFLPIAWDRKTVAERRYLRRTAGIGRVELSSSAFKECTPAQKEQLLRLLAQIEGARRIAAATASDLPTGWLDVTLFDSGGRPLFVGGISPEGEVKP